MVMSKGAEVESLGEIRNMVEIIISNIIQLYFIVFCAFGQGLFCHEDTKSHHTPFFIPPNAQKTLNIFVSLTTQSLTT